jgi:hypothetical protein
MNKLQLTKLYNEATQISNDLMDQGRAEIALEIIRENADYLAKWYPKYESCERITLIDDLTKIVFGEEEEDPESDSMLRQASLQEELKGDPCNALLMLVEEEERALVMAHRERIRWDRDPSLLANHFRVYLVDENHVDDCPSTYSDEKFKEVAEEQGFVFSLGGFEKQWNNTKLDVDQDYHWIRIL